MHKPTWLVLRLWTGEVIDFSNLMHHVIKLKCNTIYTISRQYDNPAVKILKLWEEKSGD